MHTDTNRAKITVILATHNGGEILRRTLNGYCKQRNCADDWRIIVADNNSTDNTPEILNEFLGKIPLQILNAPKAGKNSALNSIIDEIAPYNGLIIFTDDDAIPAEDFIFSWLSISESNPKASMFAGIVKPLFPYNPPKWLNDFQENFSVIYAQNDRPAGVIEARHIFGPNMAIRGFIFDNGVRFNEAIGPNSNDKEYPMGSETEFCVRLEEKYKLVSLFQPSAVVLHQIRPHQVNKSFIGNRAFRHGRGVAMQLVLSQSSNLPRRWVIKSKILISKLGSIIGINHFFWKYNWLKGFYAGLNY